MAVKASIKRNKQTTWTNDFILRLNDHGLILPTSEFKSPLAALQKRIDQIKTATLTNSEKPQQLRLYQWYLSEIKEIKSSEDIIPSLKTFVSTEEKYNEQLGSFLFVAQRYAKQVIYGWPHIDASYGTKIEELLTNTYTISTNKKCSPAMRAPNNKRITAADALTSIETLLAFYTDRHIKTLDRFNQGIVPLLSLKDNMAKYIPALVPLLSSQLKAAIFFMANKDLFNLSNLSRLGEIEALMTRDYSTVRLDAPEITAFLRKHELTPISQLIADNPKHYPTSHLSVTERAALFAEGAKRVELYDSTKTKSTPPPLCPEEQKREHAIRKEIITSKDAAAVTLHEERNNLFLTITQLLPMISPNYRDRYPDPKKEPRHYNAHDKALIEFRRFTNRIAELAARAATALVHDCAISSHAVETDPDVINQALTILNKEARRTVIEHIAPKIKLGININSNSSDLNKKEESGFYSEKVIRRRLAVLTRETFATLVNIPNEKKLLILQNLFLQAYKLAHDPKHHINPDRKEDVISVAQGKSSPTQAEWTREKIPALTVWSSAKKSAPSEEVIKQSAEQTKFIIMIKTLYKDYRSEFTTQIKEPATSPTGTIVGRILGPVQPIRSMDDLLGEDKEIPLPEKIAQLKRTLGTLRNTPLVEAIKIALIDNDSPATKLEEQLMDLHTSRGLTYDAMPAPTASTSTTTATAAVPETPPATAATAAVAPPAKTAGAATATPAMFATTAAAAARTAAAAITHAPPAAAAAAASVPTPAGGR